MVGKLPNLEQLSNFISQARYKAQKGKLPDYIPLLHNCDPQWFAIAVLNLEGNLQTMGDINRQFPLMSVIKPFTLLYLLSYFGEDFVCQKVGFEPSQFPFNSLEQLQSDGGFPRNPMINSGAIALAAFLPGNDGQSPCETLRCWLNQQANCQLVLNTSVLRSVRSLPNLRNQAIVQELVVNNHITNPEMALDTYNQICCLSGTIIDLVRLGLLLIRGSDTVSLKHCQIVSSVMKTCGLYEASAAFSTQVGLPTKSGVSGAILSLVRDQGAIACYSPPLNTQGNSVAGLWLIKQFYQLCD